MSSGSIQFRQSRNPHAGDHIARKLTTRKDLAPEPSSGLSSQPSTSQEDEPQDIGHILKNFDLTSKFGPCLGLTRLERWNRAQQLGLNPPAEVHRILESLPDEDSMHESIWAGRV
ncbi:g11983 [Coccomyxa viridis]|uniref:G11983 protein n=1 Tax=Coccomyxa viridis TaxID=1274662 RepID=A0ABP1GDX4_9CHLO